MPAALKLVEEGIRFTKSLDWDSDADVNGGMLEGPWDINEVRDWVDDMTNWIVHDYDEADQDDKDWGTGYIGAKPKDKERVVWGIARFLRQKQMDHSRLTVMAMRCVQAFWESLPPYIPRLDRPVVSHSHGRCYICACRFRQGEEHRELVYSAREGPRRDKWTHKDTSRTDNGHLIVNVCYRCIHTTPRQKRGGIR